MIGEFPSDDALWRRRASAEFRKPKQPGASRRRSPNFKRYVPSVPASPPGPGDWGERRDTRRAQRKREQRFVALILLVGAAMGLAAVVRHTDGTPRRTALAGLVPADPAGAWQRLRDVVVRPTPTPPPTPRVDLPTPIVIGGSPNLPVDPGHARRLTRDGCCAGAWWSSDGTSLRYLDRPEDAPSAAIYEVLVWPPGAEPLVAGQDVAHGGSGLFAVQHDGGAARVENLATGESWPSASGDHPARVNADGSWLVWWEGRGDRSQYDLPIGVFAAPVAGGSEPREIERLWGATVTAFHPDGRHVVVVGRHNEATSTTVLETVDVTSGAVTVLAEGSFLSDVALSPGGTWLVYMVSLDAENPDRNGIWIVPALGGEPRKLPFVGAYRWRDDDRLDYMPLDLETADTPVWEYDCGAGQARLLLDPAEAPIRVANNDWSISPDGLRLAYRSADDLNLYVMDLP